MAHTSFPADIPIPVDDGACRHLQGSTLPAIVLPTTSGTNVNLSDLKGLVIVFCYPRTGAPDEVIPDEWNSIPGARGCTPQACSFRDNFSTFEDLNVNHIFGLSTQDTPYQQEVKERTHLPYDLLSDEKLDFAKALDLPLFDWKGTKLIKRLTVAAVDGKIVKVWYPVFPPDQSAAQVLEWLKSDKK